MAKNKYIIFILLFSCYFWIINIRKKKPKISLFLPIYNKEKYITKCIKSIQSQSLKDIEIVAVNDYSSDKTLKILNDLAKIDDRIKIINNDNNRGLLYSRAMGILNSKGYYIMNMDPDDELSSNDSLEFLYNQTLISKADIISFDIYNKKSNRTIKCNKRNEIQVHPKLFESIFDKNNLLQDYLIWNKLIRREIFLKAYQTFKKEIYNYKWNYFEDNIWSILVNKYSKTKLCKDKLVYIYNFNPDSLISKRFGPIEFENSIYRHEMYKKLFKTKKEQKYLIAEYDFLLKLLKWEMKHLLLLNDQKIKEKFINIFKFFLKNYKCSVVQRNKINSFIKLIKI